MQDGLYNIRLESGGRPVNGGVVLMRDGSLLGGDAFFYYVGSYSVAGEQWSGELVIRQHTRSADAVSPFGAADVTVGLSGRCGGEAQAAVPSGGKTMEFRLTFRPIADV